MKSGETRMLDWRGVEVKVGDIVVYPVRHSSSMWMVEGEVTELHSLIEERWAARDGHFKPTQVGGVTVKRLRESFVTGQSEVPPKHVKVGLDRLTVVTPAEVMEFARYPIRYVTNTTAEDEEEALAQIQAGPGEIWTLPPGDIEIDGRAS